MTASAVDRVLEKLVDRKKVANGWMARCPAHDDRTPSLGISEGAEGKALVKCYAGCEFADVLAALSLEPSDLFAPRADIPRRRKANDAVARRGHLTTYEDRDHDGTLVAVHERRVFRNGTKQFIWRRPDGRLGLNGTRVTDLPLYGSERASSWDMNRAVVVVEGEKAADAVRAAGGQCVGTVTGAAATPGAGPLEVLKGCHVVLWPDADDIGRSHMQRIGAALQADEVAASVRIVAWPDAPEHGDAADASPDLIQQLVQDAAPHVQPVEPEAPPPELAEAFPEPEDRGGAVLSDLGDAEYVEDLVRPGRILVVAGEEGVGKSYAGSGELGVRVAVAGGSFAGTWPVTTTGPVLVLSEMHADDDWHREATILESLELDRSALAGRYFRLSLDAAAGDRPALQVTEWRTWITAWLRDHGALVAIFDTATGATQVDPWGPEMQAVFRGLRAMLADYPALAIILVVHLKKPQGRGERRISDVLGEWGRWCDVLLLLERDGESRVKLASRKRVEHERRIVATKRDGLLVDPVDIGEGSTAKVPLEGVVSAIAAAPGIGAKELGVVLGVSKSTALNYIRQAEAAGLIDSARTGSRGAVQLFPVTAPEPSVSVQPRHPTAQPRKSAQ